MTEIKFKELEQDMLDRIGKDIAREIDKELLDDLMIDVLTKDGWTPTKINPAFPPKGMMSSSFNEWYSQTAEWVHLNAQDDYKLLKGQWVFKDPKDATMFILRWA
jgi:hypothetical protein